MRCAALLMAPLAQPVHIARCILARGVRRAPGGLGDVRRQSGTSKGPPLDAEDDAFSWPPSIGNTHQVALTVHGPARRLARASVNGANQAVAETDGRTGGRIR